MCFWSSEPTETKPKLQQNNWCPASLGGAWSLLAQRTPAELLIWLLPKTNVKKFLRGLLVKIETRWCDSKILSLTSNKYTIQDSTGKTAFSLCSCISPPCNPPPAAWHPARAAFEGRNSSLVLSHFGTNTEGFHCLHRRSLVRKWDNSQAFPTELSEWLAPVFCLY